MTALNNRSELQDDLTLLAYLAAIPAHNPSRYETTDGLDNQKCTNGDRASFAAEALKSFQKSCGIVEDVETAASDLICDLLHLLHANNRDPLSVLRMGIHDFLCEASRLENVSHVRSNPSKKYIVCGRVPGADDDTLAEITIDPEQSPIAEFIEKVLYGGNIPHDWQTRPPTIYENLYGEWAYIQDLIELE